jgi:hypothetical protein
MYTGYATQFWSYGAQDFDEQGRCAIASAEGIAWQIAGWQRSVRLCRRAKCGRGIVRSSVRD